MNIAANTQSFKKYCKDLEDAIITFKEFNNQAFVVNVNAGTCNDVGAYDWDQKALDLKRSSSYFI